MTRFSAVVLVTAFAFTATAAQAHAHLKNSDPAAGSVLKSAPTSIRITFSEGLVPRFSGLALKDGGGRTVPTGDASIGGPDDTELTVPIQGTLKPGTYRVTWHAVSADTHRVGGSFSFRISP